MERLDSNLENKNRIEKPQLFFDEEDYASKREEIQKETLLEKEWRQPKLNDLMSQLNDDEDIEKSINSFIDDIKINWDIIDFDSFKKIWDWGTHDVFMSDKSKDFVLKINRWAFEMIKKKKENWELSDEDYKLIDKFMEEKNNKNNKMYEYFGIWNCLYENMRLVKIKYDNEIFECPIVFQKNTDLFSNTGKVDFWTWYIKEVNDENWYKKQNDILFKDVNADQDVSDFSIKEELIKVIPKSKDIFDKMTEPWFVEKVKEFLISFKAYYKSEWEIIDLVGKDNILFYPEWDKWHFKLWSVVKNTTRDEVNKVLWLLNTNPEEFDKNSFDEKNLNHLKNLFACSRFLNCLWIELGLGKIIELNLNNSQIENLNKMKV